MPDGGSLDMGNVPADGKCLWLSGRWDDVVYRFDTSTGAVDQVKVGREQSWDSDLAVARSLLLGHPGNLRSHF
jgi:hypothetical protein